MNKIKKITEIRTSPDWIDIFTEEFAIIDGVEVKLATPKHATPYMNSPKDRVRLQEEQPEYAINVAFSAWGDTPTIDDPPEIPFETLPELLNEIEVEPVKSQEASSSEIAEDMPKRSRKKKTDEVPPEEETENTEEQT